jgi:tetratricopeptide (TPR) repeat protein
MVWPSDLSVFYPHPGSVGQSWPGWAPAGSALFLLCATCGAVWQGRRRPYIGVGWFWYLGMLVPVIGLVQVGAQAMADRYTYLPLVGLFLSLAWAAADRFPSSAPGRARVGRWAAAALVLLLAATSWFQVRAWKDSRTLFENALASDAGNWLAHNNLGNISLEEGKTETAERHFQEVLKIHPARSGWNARSKLGWIHLERGNLDEAVVLLRESLRENNNNPEAHYYLGSALHGKGMLEEAASHYAMSLRLRPGDPVVMSLLQDVLSRKGK